MRKRRLRYFLYISASILLVVALLGWNSMRRSAHIVLPEAEEEVTQDGGTLDGDAVVKVELTADNVQAAIETLARPASYRRTIQVETYWSGGSSAASSEVTVSGRYTRVDAQLASGQVRHSITDGVHTWVWYDSAKAWTVFPVGDISADDEQRIPTYEDILSLPTSSIAEASYTDLSGVPCIFVETTPDQAGYVQRYWVSAETGLLVGAQRLADGEVVYLAQSLTLSAAAPTAEDFLLPDGTVLPGFSLTKETQEQPKEQGEDQ